MSKEEKFEQWFAEYCKNQSANAEQFKGPLRNAYMQGYYDKGQEGD